MLQKATNFVVKMTKLQRNESGCLKAILSEETCICKNFVEDARLKAAVK